MRLVMIIASLLMLGLHANAATFEKSVSGRSGSAVITTEKPIVVGVNTLRVHLEQQGKAVEGEVMVKVFMPAMPLLYGREGRCQSIGQRSSFIQVSRREQHCTLI